MFLCDHRSISERLNKLATAARTGSRSAWSFHPPPATQENNPMVKQMRGWMVGMATDIAQLDLLNDLPEKEVDKGKGRHGQEIMILYAMIEECFHR